PASAVGVKQCLGGLEVLRIPKEIPAFANRGLSVDFAGSAEIGRVVVHTPGQTALHRQNGIQRPAFEYLTRRLLSGNGVGHGIGQSMPDIEFARAVQTSEIARVDGAA